MRIFLGILVIGLAAWLVLAVYRTISCARFNRALRAEAPRFQELGAVPRPGRLDLRGYPMTGRCGDESSAEPTTVAARATVGVRS
jgi:hypothetical protein